MLIVWTGGDIAWDKAAKDFNWERTTALPKVLVGALDGEEPLYLDLRWARTEVDLSRRHPQFASAVARLRMSGVGADKCVAVAQNDRPTGHHQIVPWTSSSLISP